MNKRVDDRLVKYHHTADAHKAYDEMLNECYSFKSVGGPFTHFEPAQVLKEFDETAYRTGFNDWLDSVSDQFYEASDGEIYSAEAVELAG